MDRKHNETETYSFSQPLLSTRVNSTSQIAIFGSNICPIESLDYEILENELFKQDWRSRKKVQIFQYVILKWTFALLIGLLTGLVGIFSNIAVENLSGFKLLMTTNLITQHNCCYSSLCFHCSSSSRVMYPRGESLSQWHGCLFNTGSRYTFCKDFWFSAWRFCWICGGKRRANGSHSCLYCLFTWARGAHTNNT
ncbi:hypothetical protein Ddye_008781 [Dipteronia dyeriana]|uniref:Uncharacterized protein n=1 Tax=Dipteronia dyeriana TaxID=168575 RepID=A0AAD9XA69_9ROSI|nr:hypothetical protein Ddye_008781 [Dipteronia dyeriana]